MRRLREISERAATPGAAPIWGRVRESFDSMLKIAQEGREASRKRDAAAATGLFDDALAATMEMAAGMKDRESFTWLKRLADKRGVEAPAESIEEKAMSLPRELQRPAEVAQELGGELKGTGDQEEDRPYVFSFGDETGADQFVRMMTRDLKLPQGDIEVKKHGMGDWEVSLPPWAFEKRR